MGFMVIGCHLIDRTDKGIQRLESDIMTKQLYAGLKQNGVNFDENYRNWGEAVMIKKIGTVMGLEYIHNPDSSYVLTVDNLIKILAIQMRFRCVCVCVRARVWVASTSYLITFVYCVVDNPVQNKLLSQ